MKDLYQPLDDYFDQPQDDNVYQPSNGNYSKDYKKKKQRQKIVTALAALVVFCTTYALILPAITWERTLICELPEHHHDESCYETVIVPAESQLVCEKIEHVHGEECFDEAGELLCQSEEHTHSEECYAVTEEHTETVLVCQLAEHVHTDVCFDAPPLAEKEYFCGMIEHVHSEEGYCYFSDGSLRCTVPEHQHTLACKSDPQADLETAADWESTFSAVELTDVWPDNVIEIAKTQLGYSESALNYTVKADGETMNGYTRYGEWFGDPYGDWCAMFCSFCINYAGIDRNMMPLESSCQNWIELLSRPEFDLYHRANMDLVTDTDIDMEEAYIPVPGDLIFYDWDPYFKADDPNAVNTENLPGEEERRADHVGFVREVLFDETTGMPVSIATIEGNVESKVIEMIYEWGDDRILGFGSLPENPEFMKERTIRSEPAADGAVASVTGVIPRGAVVRIETVTLSEEELAAYFGDKASVMTSLAAYDIKILVNGEEWQPDGSVSVRIEHLDVDAPKEGLAVAHIDDSSNVVSAVSSQVDEDGNISFSADGFSVYVFYQFTVDYYCGDLEYHQQGMSTITLSELFEALSIERAAEEVSNVEFSRPDLLCPEFTDGVWTLTSLQAFNTAEVLTVTFIDGSILELNVFDAETVKLTVDSNYNLISTSTDIEDLLDEFNVRSTLGIPENTTVKSITTTPNNTSFTSKTENGKFYIVCNTARTATASCHVVFNAQEGGNDIACDFTNITADNSGKYDLWDYTGGANGANSPKVILGTFENLIAPINGVKEWTYPASANDHTSIHTDNAPIGFANAVLTTKSGTNSNYPINPIIFEGRNYYLYVATSQVNTAYNGSGYRQGATTGVNNISMGRFSRQNCSLPCVKGGLLLVCWIEDEAGNKVILPNVCVGNEGASNLWNWKFGGTGKQYIFTNDGISVGDDLQWNKQWTSSGGLRPTWSSQSVAGSVGTSVSVTNQHLFQGVLPDENGYYVVSLTESLHRATENTNTPENVDELSVFRFTAATTVKKTVLDVNGDPVTGQDEVFDFGVTYMPDESTTAGSTTENFNLANGQTYNLNGSLDTTCSVWEVMDPGYDTTIKINGTSVEGTTENIEPESGDPYQILHAPDYKISTATTVIEYINRKKPTVSLKISKEVVGITTSKAFDFTAEAADGNFIEGEGYTIDSSGQVRFQLGNGQNITLKVTPGATVTVSETEHDGYSVIFTGPNGYRSDGASGSFTMDADLNITVTNTAGQHLPATGGTGLLPIYALGVALLGVALMYFVCELRRKIRKGGYML